MPASAPTPAKKASRDRRSDAARRQLCELLRSFYAKGWVSGTGGGICYRLSADELLLAPSSVPKERVRPEELFVVSLRDGRVIERPPNITLRPSECQAVFHSIVTQRDAGSVVHSHALSAVLAADLAEGNDQLAIAGFEMLKGIRDCSSRDVHRLPVIDNTPEEHELAGTVDEILRSPTFTAARCVLVRNHGAYIWGADVEEVTRHAEVYHFLFDGVIWRTRMMGKKR